MHPLLSRALKLWSCGDYYESHEILEEFAETFEAEDPDFVIGLALVRIAASLHKLKHKVGAAAVPGKLRSALSDLNEVPAQWNGLCLAELVSELTLFLSALEQGASLPSYPCPRRVSTGT